jgi:transcriptional regulator with XRE-family HTH domain
MNNGHGPSPFGQLLQQWRRRSGLSQLDLAAMAGTTPRHVSFLETGRSRPGRELVLRLCAAMDMPLRERNALLVAAGLAPEYPIRELSDDAMRPVKLVLDRVLRGHEPFPAWDRMPRASTATRTWRASSNSAACPTPRRSDHRLTLQSATRRLRIQLQERSGGLACTARDLTTARLLGDAEEQA